MRLYNFSSNSTLRQEHSIPSLGYFLETAEIPVETRRVTSPVKQK